MFNLSVCLSISVLTSSRIFPAFFCLPTYTSYSKLTLQIHLKKFASLYCFYLYTLRIQTPKNTCKLSCWIYDSKPRFLRTIQIGSFCFSVQTKKSSRKRFEVFTFQLTQRLCDCFVSKKANIFAKNCQKQHNLHTQKQELRP